MRTGPSDTIGDDRASRRRTTGMLAVATLFALVCAAGIILLQRSNAPTTSSGESAEPQRSYNVLFIVVDSLRQDHVGAYGYDQDTTPEIDRLAREGVVFEDLIVQCSWTLPSHATMFTGLNAGAHGVDHNFERVDEEATTLPLILQQHGYRTVGIAAAPLLEEPYGFQRGFDVYDDTLSTNRGRRTPSWRTITSKKAVDMAHP